MCGIIAMYSTHKDIQAKSVQSGMNQLTHRGPDNQQYWICSDKRAGLGHTRLSIIDLTTGDQPITNEDESIGIIVNG
jgi:asparagine synthase (glutamine-hydrolysing)